MCNLAFPEAWRFELKIRIDGIAEPVFYQLGMGGAMGESNEVDSPMLNFYRSIRPYRAATAKITVAALAAKNPGDPRCYDLSLVA